jgi:hypothetical protein
LRLTRFRIQRGEDLLDDLGVIDARNDPHCPAAGRTSLDVDAEGPLQALRQVIAAYPCVRNWPAFPFAARPV